MGEPCCALVLQRSFPVVFEVISGVLSSFLPSVGSLSSGWGLPLINKPLYESVFIKH